MSSLNVRLLEYYLFFLQNVDKAAVSYLRSVPAVVLRSMSDCWEFCFRVSCHRGQCEQKGQLHFDWEALLSMHIKTQPQNNHKPDRTFTLTHLSFRLDTSKGQMQCNLCHTNFGSKSQGCSFMFCSCS